MISDDPDPVDLLKAFLNFPGRAVQFSHVRSHLWKSWKEMQLILDVR